MPSAEPVLVRPRRAGRRPAPRSGRADAGPEGTAPHYVARPGGNALNVAVAAGRLGAPVRLLARLGTGPLAANLRRHAELSGVDVARVRRRRAEPVSLAVVGLAADGSADYGFHVLGAADWQWTDEELRRVLPERTAILHVGSISSWTAPGLPRPSPGWSSGLHGDGALISVDPNIRPMLADGPGRRHARQLRGGRPRAARPADRAGRRRQGQRRGPRLARARRRRRPRRRRAALGRPRAGARRCSPTAAPRCGSPARVARCCTGRPRAVTVADTVGAGDSLAAGLLAGLLDGRGHHARGAGGAARRAPARAWWTTPRWSPR